jgi:hypothetical protein
MYNSSCGLDFYHFCLVLYKIDVHFSLLWLSQGRAKMLVQCPGSEARAFEKVVLRVL